MAVRVARLEGEEEWDSQDSVPFLQAAMQDLVEAEERQDQEQIRRAVVADSAAAEGLVPLLEQADLEARRVQPPLAAQARLLAARFLSLMERHLSCLEMSI